MVAFKEVCWACSYKAAYMYQGAKVRVIALHYGGITHKSCAFSCVITPVNTHISHISSVNWREVEFAAIYTSKASTIHVDARARGPHTSFVRAFELTGANYFYARSREIAPRHAK